MLILSRLLERKHAGKDLETKEHEQQKGTEKKTTQNSNNLTNRHVSREPGKNGKVEETIPLLVLEKRIMLYNCET